MTLDDAIDELFGVDRDAFVARRAQLVRELKEEGAKDDAEALAKLRKPTVFAWTLNQLVRSERHDVDLLLDAGHLLLEAHADILRGGDPSELDDAQRMERDAVARLERAAAKLLGGSSSTLLPQLRPRFGRLRSPRRGGSCSRGAGSWSRSSRRASTP